ncbi:hypothetical protein FSP39_014985 [Pinctada imbricata]|uniref:AAA+ ATPase domain-containing protein n=1 Tax=Pinctada imbricata TaxID=66713 RepID=A0AA88Y5E3_PINIB|nr:hypothetical protein FSP39_014985 [Pinctada imbricata]
MSEEVKRMKTTNRQTEAVVSLPLHERKINTDNVVDKLTKHTLPAGCMEPRLFHIDIYHEVDEGLDTFLFQLLVLGCLTDSSGFVWIKLPCDLYVVETMPILAKENSLQKGHFKCKHRCFDILPDVVCRSPTESLEIMMGVNRPQDFSPHDLLFDEKEFRGSVFQRPYQYLVRLDAGRGLADVDPAKTEGDRNQCLQVLLRHCGIEDPSWSELKHFVWFLNNQLLDFEVSAFCSLAAVEDLPGFAQFVLRFLIQMSRDFATRSLNMSEESPVQLLEKDEEQEGEKILDLYQLRRTWESSPHPYLFFNPDHHSMTFMGFFINPKSGDLIDQQTKQPLERGIMKKNLFDALQRNHVNLNEDFDSLPRDKKIEKLCSVMGIEHPYDPDSTYELTTDNVKKMLAIYMRFRCDIPVIIMGETGCGKTRLIKFMCSLQSPPGVEAKNMVLMKVHGGTTSADIVRKVHRAEIIAKENTQNIKHNMYTVLFFDEANTTEAIGIIKEIMCDRSINGIPLKISNNLKIVAACNPYRKHSEKLIRRLEQAGLGYHVDADKTTDKMGRVPMRRLVYRVQPLPQSMLPLVWDFGQLNTDVEEIYIRQMVLRFVNSGRLPSVAGIEKNISKILTVSQNFMRQLKDECSFVSLRDVERVLEVMSWFYNQTTGEHMTPLFRLMNRDQIDDTEEENDTQEEEIDNITRSLLLALGVCYHACLKNREQYRKAVCPHFTGLLNIPGQHNTEKAERMLEVIIRCQDAFLDNVQLGQNIARNQALKENVFMMVVCVELRIPLFLVGKPGSSKSLAKTIVADAMQGNAAHTDLFKAYKQVQMVSFQCSPLSVPEGIVGTFRQCARYQIEKDLGRFVSVVVLDEIGLAEDSPKMPLKVAFIGISNWALDPAKMNRGILVQREVPDLKELEESADLLKMVYGFADAHKQMPSWAMLKHAILRNFGGFEGIDPVKEFEKHLASVKSKQQLPGDPDCTPSGLIQACLHGHQNSESRYLLLLTENYGALSVLQQKIHTMKNAITIFGSSFPSDQEYTQVCRNINRIKVCMETGKTVVLLNLENLYESLYDALNQYYVYFGGERYVDLGLGTHRVNAESTKNSVAEKEMVYDKFPIPLINRLEKHFLTITNMLSEEQLEITAKLEKWAEDFVKVNIPMYQMAERKKQTLTKVEEVFMGFHADTCASIILHVCNSTGIETQGMKALTNEILEDAKRVLLWCATPDSVLRLKDTKLSTEAEKLEKIYFKEQKHGSLIHYLAFRMKEDKLEGHTEMESIFVQVTTSSKLLSTADIGEIANYLKLPKSSITILTLQSFDTEQQFCRQVRASLEQHVEEETLLIVQCDSGDLNAALIACARYSVYDELQKIESSMRGRIYIVFIVQLPSIAAGNFNGFQVKHLY